MGAFRALATAWVGVGLGLVHPFFLGRPEFLAIVAGAALLGLGRQFGRAKIAHPAPVAAPGAPAPVGESPLLRRRLRLGTAVLLAVAVLAAPTAIQAFLRPPIPVLTYHRVAGVRRARYPVPTTTPADFERQMRYLRDRGYQTVDLRTFAAYYSGKPAVLPRKPILITFDDGWRDTYQRAFPTLKKYGYSAAIFVVTRAVGRDLMLTWGQIRALRRAGFDIGSHTASHVNLARLSEGEALAELVTSRGELIRRLGPGIDAFCFPYGGGDMERRSAGLLKKAGYRLAFGSHAFGLNAGKPDLLRIRRILVLRNPVLARLELELLAP